jgi:alpha-glucoside transport system substrate-binding protein
MLTALPFVRPTAQPSGKRAVGCLMLVLLGACAQPATPVAKVTQSQCRDFQQYGDLTGKKVSLFTSITAPEDSQLMASYRQFESCTGVQITYEGSKGFERDLPVRVAGGSAPDLAIIPQPGLLQTMAATGKLKSVPRATEKNIDANFSRDLKAQGTIAGTVYAAPLGAGVKSYVWYSPSAFKAKGYAVPKTFAELMALTSKIAAANPSGRSRPWCAGIASQAATGWPITDWLEDMVLRTAGPDVYDQWVKHEIAFDDPKIVVALGQVGAILKNPKYVNGGLGDVASIASIAFGDAGKPIRDGSCWLHKQSGNYSANWDPGTRVSPTGDVWAFYFPPVNPAAGKPVLTGGEFVAAFADRPEVAAFQTYLSSTAWANSRARAAPATGGFVSANRNVDVSLFRSPLDNQSVRLLQDPQAVSRFDGSDQMPSAVGAGSFWREMTAWITGQSTESSLTAIEKSWPKN